MSPLTTRLSLLTLLGGALLAVGCSSPKSLTTTGGSGPEWIDRPNGVFDEGSARVVYAVGSAADNPNPAARRMQAMARARSELARSLAVLVQGMVKDYMAVNRDFYEMDTASSVEYYEDISRQVTDEMLVGSRQVDAYRDPSDNTYYVLVRLDFDDVISSYRAQMQAAYRREATRKRIKASADEFERDLDEQLDKLNEMKADEMNQAFGG